MVITSACHAEEHGFEPRTNRQEVVASKFVFSFYAPWAYARSWSMFTSYKTQTRNLYMAPWSSGLGHHPFTVVTRVRVPSESPIVGVCITPRDTQTMPPRGVSWEERAAIISLAKLLDFRDGALPKTISHNSPQGRGLRCV